MFVEAQGPKAYNPGPFMLSWRDLRCTYLGVAYANHVGMGRDQVWPRPGAYKALVKRDEGSICVSYWWEQGSDEDT